VGTIDTTKKPSMAVLDFFEKNQTRINVRNITYIWFDLTNTEFHISGNSIPQKFTKCKLTQIFSKNRLIIKI
jgi:phage terminase large subunit-like protein